MTGAHSEDSDQNAHARCVIGVFAVPGGNTSGLLLAMKRRPVKTNQTAHAQSDQSLCCAQMS